VKPFFRIPVLALVTVSLVIGGTVIGAMAQTNPFTLSQTYCLNSTMPCVLTYHNDNNRDGVNPNETVLKASTLKTSPPQPKWLASTDGLIYTQPLYVYQIPIPGKGTKNVVYAATENNTVYAFDSDSTSGTGTVLVSAQLNNASDLGTGYTEIALPYADVQGGSSCTNLVPEVGITGTPVIDVSVTPPVIYLVTTHEDIDSSGAKTFRQKFHGLFANTLTEIPGSPVILDSTSFSRNFIPKANLQRAGLALVLPPASYTGVETADIWVSFASNCDDTPYFGFEAEFVYNYSTPGFSTGTQTVFNSESTCQPSPTNPCQGGIWMGGAAPAADTAGNIYLVTGNGDDQHTQGSGEYSNSVVKVNHTGFQDFYSPPDYHQLNVGDGMGGTAPVACTNATPNPCPSWCTVSQNGLYCQVQVTKDTDLGSGGLTLLSPTFSLTNPELVTAGKQGMLYVVFSGNMGGKDSKWSVPDEYACTAAGSTASGTIRQCFDGIRLVTTAANHGLRGAPAFFAGSSSSPQNYLYVAGISDTLKAFQLQSDGTFNTTPVLPSSSHNFDYPGAVPSVTWNSSGNTSDAIVWVLDTSGFGKVDPSGRAATPAVLYAYQAVPSAGSLTPLWDTNSNGDGPFMQGAVKFVVPTIVDGKLFLAGGTQAYYPGLNTGGVNCVMPSATTQPTNCGGLAMFK
jgi:hypothetical protein